MAKKIRFPLEMKDGVEVRDIEELKENFSLEQVLFYLSDGKLITWLRDRYLDDIADAVLALNQEDVDFHKKICDIFEVEYVEEREEDIEKVMERKRKKALLKEFTDEEKFYDVVDQIAFEQDDLYDLLDEGETTIYLCGEKFSIPLGKKGIHYIGINHPVAVISSKEKVNFEEKGIVFQNIRFDEKYSEIVSAESAANIVSGSENISDEKDMPAQDDDCPEEVQEQIEQLMDDLNECIDTFLERMTEKCEEVNIAEDCELSLDPSYYDEGSYDYETKAKAKKACKEAIEDFINYVHDEYFSQRDDLKDKCEEFVENMESDVMEFIDTFIDSVEDFISADCEGEAEAYVQRRMEFITDTDEMIKQYHDLHIMEKVETYINELFNEPLDERLITKEYLEMCTFDSDDNLYSYIMSEAIDSMVDNVETLFSDACSEMQGWITELYQSSLENYCEGLKERLSIIFSKDGIRELTQSKAVHSPMADMKESGHGERGQAVNSSYIEEYGDYSSDSYLNFLLSSADRKGAEDCYNKIRVLLGSLKYDVDDDIRELREKLRDSGLAGMAESYLNSL